jgi:nucleotide-binding universal stress UspA family protein
MIKSILVCTDGSEYANTACEYALHLAQALKARVEALHVLDMRALEGPWLADLSGAIGAEPYGHYRHQFRSLMEEKGRSVLEAFRKRGETQGFKIETRLEYGHPTRVILEAEARAELVVMGQQGEHAELGAREPGSTVERVVHRTVKPCLVTPGRFEPLEDIMVAYDGSAHASQALHEAVELAAGLDRQLHILTVVGDHTEAEARAANEDAERMAGDHNCRTVGHVKEGEVCDTILETAADSGCGLIAVGAYGHSRIRELILGSTTTQLLTRSQLPLLMVR